MPRPHALQLLTGRAGSGKTARCLELFIDRISGSSRAGLDEPFFFILPSAEHKDRILALLFRDERLRGVLNFHVLTIEDFIRLKAHSAGTRVLSHFDRVWIARRILAREEWGWFDRSRDAAGLAEILADFTREAKSSLLTPADIGRILGPVSASDPYLARKEQDLRRFLEAYDAECLTLGALDEEDVLARSSKEMLERSAAPWMDVVIFDGFFGFTGTQLLFIRAMAGASRKVIVTLTLDSRTGGDRIFRYPFETRRRLLLAGFRESRMTGAGPRFRTAALGALEQNIFSARTAVSESADGVQVLSAPSERREVEMIGREILKKQRQEGHYFSDFMIVFRDIGLYRTLIEETFTELGIPFEVHERRRLRDTPLARLLLGWLEAVKGLAEGDAGKVAAFFRLETLGIGRGTAGDIEEALLRGPASSAAELVRLAPLMENGEAREVFIRTAAWFERHAAVRSRRQFREFYLSLIRFHRDDGGAGPGTEEEACAERLEEILGRHLWMEETDAPDLAAMDERLKSFLEMGLFSVSSKDRNRVQVYDASLALQKEYRVVFVAGLARGRFPRMLEEGVLLKDAERELFNAERLVLDTRDWREAGERYYFYMAVTRAREALYLSYPFSDSEGRDVQPSLYLEAARKALSKLVEPRVWAMSRVLPATADLRTEKDLLRHHAAGKSGPAVPQGFPRLELFARELAERPKESRLEDSSNLEARRRQKLALSASSIGALADCGYRHFANTSLGLSRLERRVAAIQEGILIHRVLQETVAARALKRIRDGQGFVAYGLEALERIFDEYRVELERPHEALWRRMILSKTLGDFLSREFERLSREGDFTPAKFEWSFGAGECPDAPPIVLERAGDRLEICGRVDRIDISADGRRARIIDYKRGKAPTLKSIIEGENAQAPVYLLAVRKLLGLEPSGVEFVSVSGGKSAVLEFDGAELDAFLERAEHEYWELAAKFRRSDIRPEPDVRICTMCDYDGLCRYEDWKNSEAR